MCVGTSDPLPVFPLPTNMKRCEHVKFRHSRNAARQAALPELYYAAAINMQTAKC